MEAEFTLERLKVVDPLLAAELEGLDPWQIGLVLAELAQRKRARAIAAETDTTVTTRWVPTPRANLVR